MFVPTTRYSLATHDGPYEGWPLVTPLLCDDQPTGCSVPGVVIEGQYQWGDHVLLINSWDCPFEEAYDFLLLDTNHSVVAQTSLGAPYATYLLHAHWPIDERSVRLHFHERLCYTLSIIPPSGWLARRLRLRLSRHLVEPQDERTQASIEGLRESLTRIARTTRASDPDS